MQPMTQGVFLSDVQPLKKLATTSWPVRSKGLVRSVNATDFLQGCWGACLGLVLVFSRQGLSVYYKDVAHGIAYNYKKLALAHMSLYRRAMRRVSVLHADYDGIAELR